jgi:chromosome segregation ATPase
MASNDFIIKIVLDAQSKIAPVMAAAAAEAKKLEASFERVDKAAAGLDRKLTQLEGHVSKARDTFRSINPTLDAFDRKLKGASTTMTGVNRNLSVLERNSAKAGAALGSLGGIVERLDKKLSELDRKMTEMGARKYEPKFEVKGIDQSEVKVRALIAQLASATRGVYTAKTDVEIAAAMAKAEALRKELERIGRGDLATNLILDIDLAQFAAEEAKANAIAEAANRQREADAKASLKRTEDEHRASIIRRAQVAASNAIDDDRSVKKVSVDQAALVRARAEIEALSGGEIKFGVSLSQVDRIKLEAQLKALGLKDIHIRALIDENRSQWEVAGIRAARVFQNAFQRASRVSGGAGSESASNFLTSSGLRTAAIRAAVLFSEPLLSAITAVGGALLSVGSSAGVAAAGLAGLATAGAAQAVPALGLVALAISRVAAVTKVAQLASAERDKGSKQAEAIDNQRANAADALISAQQGLKNALEGVGQAEQGVVDAQQAVIEAQKGVTDAQAKLNDARREGIRTLEDMALAERRSRLGAEQSQIALALRVAQGGSGLVQSAQLSAESDTIDANRATVDNRRAQAGGVEGLPAVVAARKGVEDAKKGVDQAVRGVENAKRALAQATEGVGNAQRAVERAQRGIAQAGDKMGAAASAYEIALGKLSKGEKVLLGSIEAFKKLFEQGSDLRGISDIIVESFARGLDRVSALLKDSTVLASFKGLATSIASAFDDLSKFLTTGPMRDALKFFADEGSKNVGTLEKILENLITIFTNVARAASAAFGQGLRDGEGSLSRIARLTSTKEWQEGASKFFTNALVSIKDFLHLGGAIIGLFAAIAGPGGGADEGNSAIERLTATIRRATKYVQENGDKVRDFLHRSTDATSDVLRVVVAIGAALVRTFDERSVKGFADFLIKTVIPVLAEFVKVLGIIDRAIFAVFNNDTVSSIVKFVAPFVLINLAIRRITIAIGLMAERFIVWLATSRAVAIGVTGVKFALEGLRLAAVAFRLTILPFLLTNPFGWAILAVTLLTALYLKFEGFRKVVDSVISWVKDHWKVLLAVLLGPFGLAIGAMAKLGPKFIQAITGPLNELKRHIASIADSIFKPLTDLNKKLGDPFGKVSHLAGGAANAVKGLFGGGHSDKTQSDAEKLDKKFQDILDKSRQIKIDQNAGPIVFPGGTPGPKQPAYKLGFVDKIQGAEDPKKAAAAAKKKRDDELANFSTYDAKVTPEEAKAIEKLWMEIAKVTRDSTDDIARYVRQMREGIEKTIDRLTRMAKSDFHDIWDSGRINFSKLDDSIAHSMGKIEQTITDAMDNIAQVFYRAFSYIADATNSSLKVFDAKPIAISLTTPKIAGKADGGYVGQPGMRGEDKRPYLLGDGEAVLNSTQQKMVNAAMSGRDDLHSIFSRSRSYHAGGAEQPGYASGGFTGPHGSLAGLTPLANFAKSKFGLSVTAGKDDHNYLTAGGNVSDHSWGGAIDLSNGTADTPQMRAMFAFLHSKLPDFIKQVIHNHELFNTGGAIVNYAPNDHFNHVHAAILEKYAKNEELSAKIISRVSKGLSVADLMSGSGENAEVDHVDSPSIKGKTKMGDLARGAVKSVLSAANKYIDKQAAKLNAALGNGGTDTTSSYEGPLDRNFGKGSNVRLSPDQVVEVAQGAGLPGRTFEQIAHGESDYMPGAVGDDAAAGYGNTFGYGLWQITPLAQGPAQWAAYAKIAGNGATPDMMKGPHPAYFNPVKNALMAKLLYQGAGNSIRPWYGTKYVTGAAGGKAPEWGGAQANGGDYIIDKPTMFLAGEAGKERATFTPLATGKAPARPDFTPSGSIAGSDLSRLTSQLLSNPKKVKDRAGDIVDLLDEFTRRQLLSLRQRLERAVKGSKSDSKIRKDLEDLQDAIKKYLNDPLTILKAGLLRFTGLTNVGGVRDILDDVGDAVDKIGRQIQRLSKNNTKKSAKKLEDALTKMGKALDFISGDDGPLALLEQQITNRTAKAARDLTNRQFKVTAGGGLRRTSLSDDRIAGQEITDLQATRTGLRGESRDVTRLLNQAQAGLRRARTNEQRQLFRGTIANLTQRRASVADQLAANAQSLVERREAQQSARADEANTRGDRGRNFIDRIRRTLTAQGKDAPASLFDAQAQVAKAQIGDLKKVLAVAQKTGNTKLAAQLQDQIDELNVSIVELAQAKLQATIDAVNADAEKKTASIERSSKIGEILGTGNTRAKNDSLIGVYNDQIAKLSAIDTSKNPALAESTNAKIQELRNSIVELTAGSLQAGIDEVNKNADRRDAGIALQGRMAALKTRLGDALGGLRDQGSVASAQLASTTQRRDDLNSQLAQAIRDGNVGVAQTLRDQIADLNVTIEEQTQTVKENTFQIRKLSVDIINGAVNRTTGLLGSVQTIRNNIASAAGNGPADQLSVLNSIKEALTTAAAALTSTTQGAIGGNEFGAQGTSILTQLLSAFTQGPDSFAGTLQSLAPIIAAFESTLGPEALAAFQAVIDGLTGNTVAITENTSAIASLNGAVTQTFSSSAWTTFRQAIFDGNGGLLPQYDLPQNIPAMATGGFITKGGLFELHAGEKVTPASQVSDSSIGEVNVHITNPTETADPAYIGKRVAWEIAASGRM